jgi:hypothetical protein
MPGVYLPPWLQTGTPEYLQAMTSGAQISNQRAALRERGTEAAAENVRAGIGILMQLKEHKDDMEVKKQEATQRLQYLQSALESKSDLAQQRIDLLGQRIIEQTDHNKASEDLQSQKYDLLKDHYDTLKDQFTKSEQNKSDRQDKSIDAAQALQDARNSGKDGSLVDVTSGSGPDNKSTRKVPVDQYNAFVRTQGKPGAPTIDTFLSTNNPTGGSPLGVAPAPTGPQNPAQLAPASAAASLPPPYRFTPGLFGGHVTDTRQGNALAPAPVAPAQASAVPTPGQVINGHVFIGGDPSQQASWKPVTNNPADDAAASFSTGQ